MSDYTPESTLHASAAPTAATTPTSIVPADPTDRPVPLWPEGVIALAAGVTLLVIGFKHRKYLMRKGKEAQRLVEEFQRQGGVEELAAVARQATSFLKGG